MILRLCFAIIYLIFALCACSSGAGGGGGNIPPGTRNSLQPVFSTENVLITENRFVSYSKFTGRVSLIDPGLEQEVWGVQASDYDFAVALPNQLGATVFSPKQIRVFVDKQQRTFPLAKEYQQVTAAKLSASYSFVSPDGNSVELVKSLTDGQWQQDVLPIPWLTTVDFSLPGGASQFVVSQLNHDGSVLIVLRLTDGAYAIFTSASADSAIAAEPTVCAGDGFGSIDTPSFASFAWDEDRRRLYVGDNERSVYAMDPDANCTLITAFPNMTLPDIGPIERISTYGNGDIALHQLFNDNSNLHVTNFDGISFQPISLSLAQVCPDPLQSTPLIAPYFLVMCLHSPDPDSRQYITFDTSTKEKVFTTVIDRETSAAIAVDPGQNLLYRVVESGFGKLETINLVTGEIKKNPSILLQNILGN